MALIHSFEKSGNFLFRKRGQIPILLFIMVIPVLYYSNSLEMSENARRILTALAILVSISGFLVRAIAIGTVFRATTAIALIVVIGFAVIVIVIVIAICLGRKPVHHHAQDIGIDFTEIRGSLFEVLLRGFIRIDY